MTPKLTLVCPCCNQSHGLTNGCWREVEIHTSLCDGSSGELQSEGRLEGLCKDCQAELVAHLVTELIGFKRDVGAS